jgi:hypothetical protein
LAPLLVAAAIGAPLFAFVCIVAFRHRLVRAGGGSSPLDPAQRMR